MSAETYDDIVVGAGIIGLAHACRLSARGRKVIVLERGKRAQGASIRNFGMLWPVGQPAGAMHDLAMSSRDIWSGVLRDSGIWHDTCGSLHLAYHEDELEVLREFAKGPDGAGFGRKIIGAAEILERSPAVKPDGLLGGLWSPTEICVDPRRVIAELPIWMAAHLNVEFKYDCSVTSCATRCVLAGNELYKAERVWLCTGDDLVTLFPDAMSLLELVPCKLQMMRSQCYGSDFRIGPMLAAGLTLCHYGAFQTCPSLPALRARFKRELPQHLAFGIHVMASQHSEGEITIGDSHEYADAIRPFDSVNIDHLILDYLAGFFKAPDFRIESRWHGIYVKHPSKPYVTMEPLPSVTVVTGLGGAGMTLSFGVAERTVRERLGE